MCEIGNSKDYIQHGLVSVKHIFQDLHAPPNVPVHFTGLEYLTSVVSVAGKNPLDAGQCLILHQTRYAGSGLTNSLCLHKKKFVLVGGENGWKIRVRHFISSFPSALHTC